MSDRICSNCVHAALDQSGVYCKLFHEQIWNEEVAQECGEFEDSSWPSPAADTPRLFAVPDDWVPPERERTLSFEIHLEYFGKEQNGVTIEKNLARELALHYGERVRMKRL